MKPLGSFEIDPIGTPIDVIPFFTPAILLQPYTSTTTAYDTCRNKKTNYTGAVVTHHGLTGAAVTPATIVSWPSGIGSVKITPAISETDNTITVRDPATNIADTSNFFDTQQKICTLTDATDCTWSNGKGINASALKPATGSLGVGFNPVVQFSCNGGNTPLGGTVITIAPHDTSTLGDQVEAGLGKRQRERLRLLREHRRRRHLGIAAAVVRRLYWNDCGLRLRPEADHRRSASSHLQPARRPVRRREVRLQAVWGGRPWPPHASLQRHLGHLGHVEPPEQVVCLSGRARVTEAAQRVQRECHLIERLSASGRREAALEFLDRVGSS